MIATRSDAFPPLISVISPVFNRQATVRQSLDSVLAAAEKHGGVEVIVVDNGSTDGTYEMLTGEYAGRVRVEQVRGTSIGGLRNRGAALARGDILCFLDSDCLVPPDYFERVTEVLAETGAAATGSMVYVAPGVHWIEETFDRLSSRRYDSWVHFIAAANFAVRREAFQQVGGFDERLVTGEDADISQRLLAAGFRLYQSQAVRATHLRDINSLGDYFAKQVWHGLGMFTGSALDKTALMTFAHLALNLAAVAMLFMGQVPLWQRLAGALAAVTLVPAAAVAYRYYEQRIFYRPLRSLLLYWLYFYARVWALFRVAAGQGR